MATARKPKGRSGSRQPESRTRELGAPVVVSARYPQALLDAIDAARGDSPRQRWLVEAATQRLEREDASGFDVRAEAEAQAELTAARERAEKRKTPAPGEG